VRCLAEFGNFFIGGCDHDSPKNGPDVPTKELAMAAHPVTHPSADALRAFALGKLNDLSSTELMNHLDSCPDCCKQVAALSGDDFLNRLRQVRGRSSTPARARASSGTAETAVRPKPSANQPPIPNLPPELANNPQYEILRELGRGGMGVVYLAKNKLMERLEVLKVVNKTLLDHPGAVERFLREIRAAAKLSHANVVAAHSAVQMGELLAFAMEYVEGQDLARLVKSQGPLPVPHACYYAQQAALGLQHAFEKGMVHRDIKPQNLILAREGKKHIVKVLDFGLAKATREKKDDTGLTGEGKMLGTPDYIAPEQTLDAAKADIRADIYSLGCTLYYLLSGRPPFSAGSLTAVLVAHQMHETKPLNLVRPEVPEELAAVVRKMMAKSPAKRYQTPLDVAQALSPFVKPGATAKLAPELSSSAMEAKSVVKRASPADPPPTPAAELPKKQPEPVEVWESLTERSVASTGPRKSQSRLNRRSASARTKTRKKRLVGGGFVVGVLLLALLAMWASGVFKVKTNIGEEVEIVDGGHKVLSANLEPARVAPPKNPLDLWFAVGTRWEGKAVSTSQPGVSVAQWFTVLSRTGNKFKGRLVGEGRMDLTIEGTLGEDGTSFRWTSFRHTPNVWRPQPEFESVTGEGKCMRESTRIDFQIKQLDGQTIEGYWEFSTRRDGPRKDDEKVWPPPLYPRRARITGAGKWRVDGDELVQEEFVEDVNNNPGIQFGDLGWKDYDFHFKAMRTAGDDGFRVFFDALPRKVTQWCINRQTFVELVEFLPTGAKFPPLSDRKAWAIADNQWYDILIKTRGQWIECILDGESVFNIPHPDRWGGKVGFTCMRMAGRFKDIEVTAPDGKILWKKGPPELPNGD
jgi:serine/threonine protein kinase